MEPSKSAEVRRRLLAQRVLPVLRLDSAAATEQAVDCLLEAGYRCIEITMTTPDAPALLERLAGRLASGTLLGAGTVLDATAARRCLDAGARFLVSPCRVPELVPLARAAGAALLPGAFTPAEVLAAHGDGADIVKVFPAASGGPEHIAALRAVFPHIALCPTGGLGLQNIGAYFKAGAALAGVGNNLINRRALAAGDRAAVVALASRYLQEAAP